jgi:hypothetical protein
METLTEKQTIIKVTELLEKKNRFAFVTYTRSSLFTAIGELKGDKKPPKNFTNAILAGLTSSDPMFVKASQKDFLETFEDKLNKVGLSNQKFANAAFLEGYINSNEEVFKIFMSHYLKHTKCLVISFQYKSLISKYFSKDSAFIHVPYNDFYEKIDSVMSQISEFSNEYDFCVLDCPMFSSAIAPKIWDTTKMSILDLGKSLTVARAVAKARV